MTALDAYRAEKRELDKFESPTFTVGDFNHFWNSTTDEYIALNYATLDVNQKTLDDVQSILILGEPLTMTNGIGDLPVKYRHMLGLEVVLKFTEKIDGIAVDTERTVYPKRMRTNRSGFAKPNAYQKPSYKNPYFQITKGKIHVLNGVGTSVVSAKIDYLEKPEVVYLNPDSSSDYNDPINNTVLQFPDHVNFELIKHCRRIFLENIESPRYQSSLQEQMLRKE